jgi:hypothetical protein
MIYDSEQLVLWDVDLKVGRVRSRDLVDTGKANSFILNTFSVAGTLILIG